MATGCLAAWCSHFHRSRADRFEASSFAAAVITTTPLACNAMRAHPQPHSEEDKKEGITEFWHPHDLYELVRSVAGDVVERVDLQETFVHPVTGR